MILEFLSLASQCVARFLQFLFFILELFPVSQKSKIFMSERKSTCWKQAIIDAKKRKLQSQNPNAKTFWIHVASAGELEQIIPTLRMLHNNFGVVFFLTYFSPSAKAFVKNCPGLIGASSLPLENKQAFQSAIDSLDITRLVLVRYDFWPALISTFTKNNLPVCIMAATLRRARSPLPAFLRSSLRRLWFGSADTIFLVDADEKELLILAGISEQKIFVAGDAKWARARERAADFHKRNTSPPIQAIRDYLAASSRKTSRRAIVFGSPHAEEIAVLLRVLAEKPKDVLFIVAPPEVDDRSIGKLASQLSIDGVRILKISDAIQGMWPAELCLAEEIPLVILDTFGHLAEAYGVAEVAVVGGGFDGQLHNVLEPAALPVATVFGDKTDRAPEAQILLTNNAALSFAKPEMLFQFLHGWSNLGSDDAERGNLQQKLLALRLNSASLFASLPDTSEVVCRALANKDALEAL
jgi:3-deoxy-D-manno-octulosonic-acid transferase